MKCSTPIRFTKIMVLLAVACFALVTQLFAQTPTISSIAPTSGIAGSSVTITGTAFNTTASNNIVYVSGVKATVTAAAATSLTITVPRGATYGPVTVLNTGNNLLAISSQYFLTTQSPNKSILIKGDLTIDPSITANSISIYGAVTGDLNGDGKPDLVAASNGFTSSISNTLTIRLNNGTNGGVISFAAGADKTFAGYNGQGIPALGDLDGDGYLDITALAFFRNASSTITDNDFFVLRNSGDGVNYTQSAAFPIANLGANMAEIGDLDGDGKADLIIACYNNSKISIFPNTSSGPGNISFGTELSLSTGSSCLTARLADIDGDGKPDIVSTNSSATGIQVWRNTSTAGNISFAAAVNLATFGNPNNLTIGDINGDGKHDIVVTYANNLTVDGFSIFPNNCSSGSITSGDFGTRIDINIPGGYSQQVAALGDINGDGKPELVVASDENLSSQYQIFVYNNTSVGSISFDEPNVVTYKDATINSFAKALLIADFNNDGKQDLVAGVAGTARIIMLRNTFQSAPVITSFSPATAAAGASVTISGSNFNTTASNNIVYFGATRATVVSGNGTSLTVTVPLSASYGPITVLNSPGGVTGASKNYFLPAFSPNKTTLAATDFTQQSTITSAGTGLYGLLAVDLDNDKKPELVETDRTSNQLVIRKNSSAANTISFGSLTTLSMSSFAEPGYPAAGDLDGDGAPDIVVPSITANKVVIIRNTGTLSTFTATASYATGTAPIAVAIGDLDGDGRLDMVVANSFSSSISVFRNTSTASGIINFATREDYNIGSDAIFALQLADIDGDGKVDIITQNTTTNPVPASFISVFRNTSTNVGTITLATRQDFTSLSAPWGMAVGDLDGDGKPDLIVSNSTTNTQFSVFRNTSSSGTIAFDSRQDITTAKGQKWVSLGDLNGDGKPDLVLSLLDPISASYYILAAFPNTSTSGAISFGTRVDLAAESIPQVSLVQDLDGDGKPDVLSGNFDNHTITVHRNTLVAAPLTQVTNIIATATGTTVNLSWTIGSGNKRAVFMLVGNAGTVAPVNNTDYTANTVFGSGSQVGSTGWYCVYNGTGTSVTVSGLTPSTTYRIMATEYNDGGFSGTAQYQTATATGNPVNITALATLNSISRTTASATINTNSATHIVVFGSAVTGLSTSNFSITSTGITSASITSVTGSGTTYTVTTNTGSGDGTLRLNLANMTSIVPGLTNSLPFAGETYTIDKTAPTLSPVSITSNNTNTALAKVGDIITLVFTTSESISTPTVTVAGQAAAISNTSGNNWSATYTMATGDTEGNIGFSIVFSDVTGNAGTTVTATTNSSSVNFDKTAPTLSSVSISSSNANTVRAKVGDIITLLFTANEAIATPTVTISGQTVTATNTGGNNWSATYTMATGDTEGNIGFSIVFSDVTGNAGTTVTATTNSSNVSFDKTAPTLSSVSISSSNASTARAKVGDIITLLFTASEPISTPTVTISGQAATVTNTSGNNWSATYTMAASNTEGTIGLSIIFSDITGNAGTTVTATTNSSSVNFDKTAPTLNSVSISSSNTNTARAKVGDIITLLFTANESISTPTVTIAGQAATVTNTSGNNWSATYTMAASNTEGNIGFSIVFSDITGNAGTTVTATTNSSNVSFDKTAPTLSSVSISSSNANTARAKVGDIITLLFTASEPITTPAVTISGQTVTATNTGGNNWSATYTMAASNTEGTIGLSIIFSDVTGNIGTTVTATTNSSSVNFDKTAPTISSAGISSSNTNTVRAKVGDIITVLFTANESISTPTVTIAGQAATVTNTSGNNWSATYTMAASNTEGNIGFSIVFSDVTGNAGTTVTATTNSSNVNFDKTAPTLNSVSISSSNANTARAKVGDIITLLFTGNESISTPTVTIAGQSATVTNTGGNNWSATYTMAASNTEGMIGFSIVFSDITSNAGTAVTATTNSSSVSFVKTTPVLNSVSIVSSNTDNSKAIPGDIITLRFTGSTTLQTPLVSIATHTAAVTNTGGNNWEAAYTMTGADVSGIVPFSIAFTDLYGNTGTTVTGTSNNSTVNFLANAAPVYAAAGTQSLSVCANSSVTGISNLLRATDTDNGQTLTWTLLVAPARGTVTGLPATAATNGATVTPGNIGYQPSAGFSGTDVLTIRVSDGTATADMTINITVNALPTASISALQGTVLCGTNGTVTLTATGGNSYNWFKDGSPVGGTTAQLVVSQTGVYTAQALSSQGCMAAATGSITVTQQQAPIARFVYDNYCINTPIQFSNQSVVTNSGTVAYQWTDNAGHASTTTAPVFTFNQAGNFDVKLKIIPQACPALADSVTQTIAIAAQVSGIRLPTIDVVKNTLTSLQARTQTNAIYNWMPNRFLTSTTISNPQFFANAGVEYQIAVKTPAGCTTVDTLLVRVQEAATVYLANVFTPNGDGQNDKLIINSAANIKSIHYFRVFNRWGRMMFETRQIGEGWDGKFNGQLQPMDTYTWILEAIDTNGNIITKQGSVTLLR